jgi:hypothetical protein
MQESKELVEIFQNCPIKIEAQILSSSNAAFLVFLQDEIYAIYKPEKLERPLWDFEPGLWRREVAAYLFSKVFPLCNIPLTVKREGPLGVGSLQLVIDATEDHYLTLKDSLCYEQDFINLAVFDIITNNADRKSGHVLKDLNGKIWAIDHGLCFHTDFKLRTVIWDFAGYELDRKTLELLQNIKRSSLNFLAPYLKKSEIQSIIKRTQYLYNQKHLPLPKGRRPYPWPVI